jgi:small basic protein (TIGR04137 family)
VAKRAVVKFQHCGQQWFCYLCTSFFTENQSKEFMSQHRSLRAASTLGGKRNVLKRFERTDLLKKRGQWKDGDRITGLRKTKPAV